MSDNRKHSWSFQSEDLQEKLENEGVGCIKVVLWCCELSDITIRQQAQFSQRMICELFGILDAVDHLFGNLMIFNCSYLVISMP